MLTVAPINMSQDTAALSSYYLKERMTVDNAIEANSTYQFFSNINGSLWIFSKSGFTRWRNNGRPPVIDQETIWHWTTEGDDEREALYNNIILVVEGEIYKKTDALELLYICGDDISNTHVINAKTQEKAVIANFRQIKVCRKYNGVDFIAGDHIRILLGNGNELVGVDKNMREIGRLERVVEANHLVIGAIPEDLAGDYDFVSCDLDNGTIKYKGGFWLESSDVVKLVLETSCVFGKNGTTINRTLDLNVSEEQ